MTRANTFAFFLLAVMFLIMISSVWNDSATTDELAHIPAGYSYVTQLDYRLNPEHPPLLKDLAGLSARIFANPYFSTNTPSWRDDINGQWTQGNEFLYESGNNADRIIFWARLPLMLLAVLFGAALFWWTKKHFGGSVAILTLTLFAFSPTVLAHSRYVTTDLGAAFGFFIGIIGFLAFLEQPSRRNVIIAGLLFGIAQLLKFSLLLLIPLYGILLFAWVLVQPKLHVHERGWLFTRLFIKTAALGLIGLALIWIVYIPHVWGYPQERQFRDAEFILTSFPLRPLAEIDLALIRNPFTRPLGQYGLGALMVIQRAGGGNDNFFLGTVSAEGSLLYFPLLYLLKEQLPLHILTIIALGFAVLKLYRRFKPGRAELSFGDPSVPSRDGASRQLGSIHLWINKNFAEFSVLVFIGLYWFTSVTSPLNIGVRHILPTLPFIFLLVSRQIVGWIHIRGVPAPETWRDVFRNFYKIYLTAIPKYLLVTFLFFWMITNAVGVYPHFLSYYNELAGGTANGYRIAVDSNYDWGQDLKRLQNFAEENKIEKISVDYFGGGGPRYYLGDRFEPWRSSYGPARGWFAISATFRENGFGAPAPGFLRKPEDSYEWLRRYEPVARAGHSIFIYQLP